MTVAESDNGRRIIDAIKTVRRASATGRVMGAATDKVWANVHSQLSQEQFGQLLQQLLDEKVVVAVSRAGWVKNLRFPPGMQDRLTTTIPTGVDFGKRGWDVDGNGQAFDLDEHGFVEHTRYASTLLYVKSGGLPNSVEKLLEKVAK